MCSEPKPNLSSPLIKKIWIEIYDYCLYHAPSQEKKIDSKFLGREHQLNEMIGIIRQSKTPKGKYLISGARGAGKTSFVNKVVTDLNIDSSDTDYISISVIFSDDLKSERDVMIHIIRQLYKYLSGKKVKDLHKSNCFFNLSYWNIILFLLATAICVFFMVENDFSMHKLVSNYIQTNYLYRILISLFYCALVVFIFELVRIVQWICFLVWRRNKIFLFKKIKREIKQTLAILNAKKIIEKGLTFKMKPVSIFGKTKEEIGLITENDLEDRIKEWTEKITDKICFDGKQVRFIIIFDELDKLGLRSSNDELKDIVDLFSRLKSFLANTHAKFFFISGNEMHQEYLDIYADRSNKLISIIDHEIQITSFLSTKASSSRNPKELIKQNTSKKKKQNEENLEEKTLRKSVFRRFFTIESYVCHNIRNGCCSINELVSSLLKDYEEQLINEEKEENEKTTYAKYQPKPFHLVQAIYHFVNYLVFVSNGNPKKIMMHFEKQLIYTDKIMKNDQTQYSINISSDSKKHRGKGRRSSEKNKRVYFYLGYSDMIRNSFINYLTTPINFAVLQAKNSFSDNLLVSSSYILNHFLKYHKNSFSLRNREQFPDIFQNINSASVREITNQIILYLKKSHLQTILSSVFRYKFPIQITEEIKNITNLSEELSNQFNYSHKEFGKLKSHYLGKINEQLGQDSDPFSKTTIASFYHILGDLDLFTYEINEAIMFYKKAIEQLKQINHESNETTLNFLMEYTRIKLKLGLAYEKRGTFASAQNIYSELHRLIKKTLIHQDENQSGRENNYSLEEKGNFIENVRMTSQPMLARLYIKEKVEKSEIKLEHIDEIEKDFDKLFGFVLGREQAIVSADFYKRLGDILYYKNNLVRRLKPSVQNIMYFYSLHNEFEEFGAYEEESIKQPNFESEKNKRIFSEAILRQTNPELFETSNRATENECYPILGKERTCKDFEEKLNRIQKITRHCLENQWYDYEKVTNESSMPDTIPPHVFSPSCFACKYYSKSITELLYRFNQIPKEKTKLESKPLLIIRYLQKGRFNLRSANYLQLMASSLSSLGDTLLACKKSDEPITADFLRIYKELFTNKYDGYKLFISNYGDNYMEYQDSNFTQKVLLYYYLSSRFYNKAGKKVEFIIQLKKILLLLAHVPDIEGIKSNDNIKCHERKACGRGEEQARQFGKLCNNSRKTLDEIVSEIIRKIDDSLGYMYDHVNILESIYLKQVLKECSVEKSKIKTFSSTFSSVYADIEDAIYYAKEIFLNLGDDANDKLLDECSNLYHQSVSTIYNRMLKLRLVAKVAQKALNLDFKSIKDKITSEKILNNRLNSFDDIKDVIESGLCKYIFDAIFALKKFVQYVSTQNDTKLFTNSIISEVYFELAMWTLIYLEIAHRISEKNDKDISKEWNKVLQVYINLEELELDDLIYFIERSKDYYYKALELHSQGKNYHNTIDHMYLLNDDLSDDLHHFFIALERYRFNRGHLEYLYRFKSKNFLMRTILNLDSARDGSNQEYYFFDSKTKSP